MNQANSLDEAELMLGQIAAEVREDFENITSEEDSKVKIINRILLEVLGWPHKAFKLEKHNENGFSDYVISHREEKLILIEAKRIGRIGTSVARKDKLQTLRLSGTALKDCQEGIKQAWDYAAPHGLPLCVLTDGTCWIVFKPNIPGSHFMEKSAFVFPSFDAVQNNFSEFFELLSPGAVSENLFAAKFEEIHNPKILVSNPLVAAVPKRKITREQKTEFAFEVEKIFDAFFDRMRGDKDEDLLIECFVETRESRIADFSLEKMTANVLGNIDPNNRDISDQLNQLLGRTVEQDEGETVFIVGPTGSGKTTFLERFFRKTLTKEVRRLVVPLRLNCLDATGDVNTALPWMIEQLIQGLEKDLYKGEHPTWDDLRGLYFSEYRKKSVGIDRHLYESDREGFRRKFSDFMEVQMEQKREDYLQRLLYRMVHDKKKMPVLIIDNTDEFSPEFKEAVFQLSQSLKRNSKYCMVIFPVTDKSAWAFSKSDIYSIYQSKSFFLPTPPPREIFRKRVDYVRTKIEGDNTRTVSGQYLSSRGIQINISDLSKFISVVEEQFVSHEYYAKLIGELSNYNIRRTLELARRVMTSSSFSVDSAVSSYFSQATTTPNVRIQFMNALLKGDYRFYFEDDLPEVQNVFSLDDRVKHSPLMQLRILTLLSNVANSSRDIEGRHLECQEVRSYFRASGANEAGIDRCLNRLSETGLIERFDLSKEKLTSDTPVAISHSGRAHLNLATSDHTYFEQMALTTPISDEDFAAQIASSLKAKEPWHQKYARIRSIFAEYLLVADSNEIQIHERASHYRGQNEICDEIASFITVDIHRLIQEHSEESGSPIANELDTRKSRVSVVVDWFSSIKGFGFCVTDSVEGRVFLHKNILDACGFDDASDGDEFVCDIEFGDKGPYVSKVIEMTENETLVTEAPCKVVRLFPERNYGFVRSEEGNTSSDAFFHFSLLDDGQRQSIAVGDRFTAKIKWDTQEKGPQVTSMIESQT